MWSLTTDLRGIDNVPCSGVQDICGATVANCGTGPEGAQHAQKIVTAVNAYMELVATLQVIASANCDEYLDFSEMAMDLKGQAEAALAKVQS